MLETKQDELLLADRLSLFDQNLAASIGVVMVGNLVPRLFSKPGGGLGLVFQSRRAIQLVGDQAEENLTDSRRA